ncbi:unnamed protein product, partial [Ectocarpus sp. 13 AM-2016]
GVPSSTHAGGTSVPASAASCFSSSTTGEGTEGPVSSASTGAALSSTTPTMSCSTGGGGSSASSATEGSGTTPCSLRTAEGVLSSTTAGGTSVSPLMASFFSSGKTWEDIEEPAPSTSAASA